MNVTGIYRTFYLSTEQYTCFSSAPGTFSRIDYALGHKTSLSKVKKTEAIPSVFYGHNGMKLETNKKRKTRKFTNI